MNNTSSIHNYEFDGFETRDQVHIALARMFASAGADHTTSGRFLAHCGIRKWSDLTNPIRLKGWDRYVPFEHDIFERRLRRPGPNNCHPDAVFGQHCRIRFGEDRLWHFRIHYGYSHDASTWDVAISQHRGESLHHFGQRVRTFVASLFEPETEWEARARAETNGLRDRVLQAASEVFWDRHRGLCEKLVAGLLQHQTGGSLSSHRITLTPQRYATLQRWAAQDRRQAQ